MKSISLLFILSLFLATHILRAQEATEEYYSIHSEIFGTYRSIHVFVPENYYADSTTAFAVTYVLDAQYGQLWNMAKANIEYMVDTRQILPTIIVGVVSEDRGDEFDPPATTLLDHLEPEVVVEVERDYRTSGLRCVIGHSWGGAFIGSTLFSDRRDLFDAYIGISPSFGDTDNIIVQHADSMLQENTVFGKFLYFSHGDVGRREVEFGGYVNSIDSLLWLYPNRTLAFEKQQIKGTDHWSVVIPSIEFGLLAMTRNYYADQIHFESFAAHPTRNLKDQVASFYRQQEAVFGNCQPVTAGDLNFYGNDFRDLGQLDRALECYKWAVELDPSKLTYRIGVADTYLKLDEKLKAEEALVDLGTRLDARKDELPEDWYSGVREWVDEKLAGLK